MPKLHQIIEHHWQRPKPWLSFLLSPLSRLFGLIAARRRQRYLSGKTVSEKLAVPLVIVGNIHAGGAGKTPVVAALVTELQQRGFQTGIISRGYGRQNNAVHVLTPDSTVQDAGDEPLLLYRQTGTPTAVAAKRAEAGKALLAAYPNLDLIVADDGLQHYALARDMEIIVFPAADAGRRDLDLLPNGNLREPLSRLASADAVLISGGSTHTRLPCLSENHPLFFSRLETQPIYRLGNPQQKLDPGDTANAKIIAAAGIAKPERFFNTLTGMGLKLNQTLALPDHADISQFEFPKADIIVITEKDAVKLSDRHLENVWVLPVCAIIEPDLASFVIQHLQLQPSGEREL